MLLCQQSQDKTDEELLELSKENHNYFLCLMQRYESKILRYIHRISGLKTEDCEDLLQEIFFKAYRNMHSFSPDLKFSAWLYRIAHNQVISNYRKLKARPTELYEVDDGPTWSNLLSDMGLSEEINNHLLNENIWQVLMKLDSKYREVLVLRFLEDLDYKEISDVLQKPISTVGTLISRAKNEFAKTVALDNRKLI